MLRLTRHGLWEMVIGTFVLIALAAGLAWLWWPLAILPLVVLIWLFAFFRDPERPVSEDARAMVSPADGTVSDITQIEEYILLGGPCVRIGIFLSVFNVHINRSPCDGLVSNVIYRKGKFFNALRHGDASAQNESNTVVLLSAQTHMPIAVVKQIVGLIARRIICTLRVGDPVTRGQRIGMIKFGSRTELYIPAGLKPTVQVRVGQKVRGGIDVIAMLDQPLHALRVEEDVPA